MNESEVELFPAAETERYRTEWRSVQAGFVDDPEAAVRAADKLVEQAMDTVAGQLAQRRKELAPGNGDGQRTEQLRVALRRYRSLFGQLTGLTPTDNSRPKPTTDPPRTPAPTGDDRRMTPTSGVRPPTDGEKDVTPTGDDKQVTPTTGDDKHVRPPTDGERDVTPTTDGAQRVLPSMKSRGARRADASEPAVDGGDELVQHRADLPDTD